MRQMGINVNKITRNILVFLITLLCMMFIFNMSNYVIMPDKIVSFLGEKIYAAEMPIYSYMNEMDSDSPETFIDKFVSLIYPINSYISSSTTSVYIGNPDEHIIAGVPNTSQNTTSNANTEGETASQNNSTEATNPSTTGNQNTNTNTNTTNPPNATNSMSAKVAEAISNNVITGSVYPKASLENFSFLFSNFYTVTSITTLNEKMLKPKEFLSKDLTVSHDANSPQILIFHTHSQETFADSKEGDPNTSIVGVGEYLTEILREKYGLNVIHDTTVYDYVNGVLDRSKAYTYSEAGIKKILDQNPSIEVVIDLHRDGVSETTHFVTEINGKQTAKVMFFNGLSYSNQNKDISYLYNPYRDDNLAMSLQMQLLGNAYYPGYLRRIYINAYRYCLHLRPKSMLIEAGAQTNTVEEEMNAMEPLADILNKLLTGQKAY